VLLLAVLCLVASSAHDSSVAAAAADTLFGADLTIMEEGTELLHRLQVSCSGSCADIQHCLVMREGVPWSICVVLREHAQVVNGSFAIWHL
jgi:hypothetical protein